MIRFRLIEPEVLRQIQLQVLDDPTQEYEVVGYGLDDRSECRTVVEDVPIERIASVLRSIPDYPESEFDELFAHWMSVAVGAQLWPDGNHRTAFLLTQAVCRYVFADEISLTVEQMDAMRQGSKRLLHVRHTLPGQPVYSPEELGPGHPLRKHFATFARSLKWKPLG